MELGIWQSSNSQQLPVECDIAHEESQHPIKAAAHSMLQGPFLDLSLGDSSPPLNGGRKQTEEYHIRSSQMAHLRNLINHSKTFRL